MNREFGKTFYPFPATVSWVKGVFPTFKINIIYTAKKKKSNIYGRTASKAPSPSPSPEKIHIYM